MNVEHNHPILPSIERVRVCAKEAYNLVAGDVFRNCHQKEFGFYQKSDLISNIFLTSASIKV